MWGCEGHCLVSVRGVHVTVQGARASVDGQVRKEGPEDPQPCTAKHPLQVLQRQQCLAVTDGVVRMLGVGRTGSN